MEYPEHIKRIVREEVLKSLIVTELPHSGFEKYGPYYGEETKQVTGSVYYPGCGEDLSDLLVFPNASLHIHQDLYIPTHMDGLLGYMRNVFLLDDFSVVDDKAQDRLELELNIGGVSKRLIFYKGNVAFLVPEEAAQGLDGIYRDLPPYSFKMLLINFLPLLKLGGLFLQRRSLSMVGLEPIDGPAEREIQEIKALLNRDEKDFTKNEVADRLLEFRIRDLEEIARTLTHYVKRKHLSQEELERVLRFNVDMYRKLLEEEKVIGL